MTGGARFRVAVVGATGAVGREMLQLLETRRLPVGELVPFASERSVGGSIGFGGARIPLRVPTPGCFRGLDVALFSAGATVSREWAPRAVSEGCLVVDNSSAWRMDPAIPLVVPEVNAHALPPPPALIANPNCSTIQMVMALEPLHRRFGLERVIVSTYQSTSGAGARALAELDSATRGHLAGQEPPPQRFAHPIAFNLIPQIDDFAADGYTKEEWKMLNETRKIMGLPDLPVTPTCVRVPVHRGHSEMLWTAFRDPVDPEEARRVLAAFPGIEVQDDPAARIYPMPRPAAGQEAVFVGRIRRDPCDPRALVLWVVSDNLLKGAALNAIQIAAAVLGRPGVSDGQAAGGAPGPRG